MIRTVMTPDKEDISIHLPLSYVGKKIEVLLYAVDELTENTALENVGNNARLRGSMQLSDEEYQDFQKHANDIRTEWQTNI